MSGGKKAFIFSGPPGAGKGTIAHMCEEKLGWVQLSTGDLCRMHISEGTELGKQMDFAIKSGKLVDDALIIDMVSQWVEQNQANARAIIFDGFPRTLTQARLFGGIVAEKLSDFVVTVVNFEISDAVVIKRLSSRRTCSNKECQSIYSIEPGSQRNPKTPGICDLCGGTLMQRSDDSPETVTARLQVYRQHAGALLSFYREQGFPLKVIDAQGSVEEVFEKFVASVAGQYV